MRTYYCRRSTSRANLLIVLTFIQLAAQTIGQERVGTNGKNRLDILARLSLDHQQELDSDTHDLHAEINDPNFKANVTREYINNRNSKNGVTYAKQVTNHDSEIETRKNYIKNLESTLSPINKNSSSLLNQEKHRIKNIPSHLKDLKDQSNRSRKLSRNWLNKRYLLFRNKRTQKIANRFKLLENKQGMSKNAKRFHGNRRTSLQSASARKMRRLSRVVPGKPEVDYPLFASVPRTNFTCRSRTDGYHADETTRCQVYHICKQSVLVGSSICPNGTVFNDKLTTCDWWFNTNCGNLLRNHRNRGARYFTFEEDWVDDYVDEEESPKQTQSRSNINRKNNRNLPEIRENEWIPIKMQASTDNSTAKNTLQQPRSHMKPSKLPKNTPPEGKLDELERPLRQARGNDLTKKRKQTTKTLLSQLKPLKEVRLWQNKDTSTSHWTPLIKVHSRNSGQNEPKLPEQTEQVMDEKHEQESLGNNQLWRHHRKTKPNSGQIEHKFIKAPVADKINCHDRENCPPKQPKPTGNVIFRYMRPSQDIAQITIKQTGMRTLSKKSTRTHPAHKRGKNSNMIYKRQENTPNLNFSNNLPKQINGKSTKMTKMFLGKLMRENRSIKPTKFNPLTIKRPKSASATKTAQWRPSVFGSHEAEIGPVKQKWPRANLNRFIRKIAKRSGYNDHNYWMKY